MPDERFELPAIAVWRRRSTAELIRHAAASPEQVISLTAVHRLRGIKPGVTTQRAETRIRTWGLPLFRRALLPN